LHLALGICFRSFFLSSPEVESQTAKGVLSAVILKPYQKHEVLGKIDVLIDLSRFPLR